MERSDSNNRGNRKQSIEVFIAVRLSQDSFVIGLSYSSLRTSHWTLVLRRWASALPEP
jgi:hypothetical protein